MWLLLSTYRIWTTTGANQHTTFDILPNWRQVAGSKEQWPTQQRSSIKPVTCTSGTTSTVAGASLAAAPCTISPSSISSCSSTGAATAGSAAASPAAAPAWKQRHGRMAAFGCELLLCLVRTFNCMMLTTG
jgi:hypothetical protein